MMEVKSPNKIKNAVKRVPLCRKAKANEKKQFLWVNPQWMNGIFFYSNSEHFP